VGLSLILFVWKAEGGGLSMKKRRFRKWLGKALGALDVRKLIKAVAAATLVLFLLLAAAVIWYQMPRYITGAEPEEIGKIVIFDGSCGKELSITDKDVIESLVDNFRSVKIKRDGLSLGYSGYHYRIAMYRKDDQKAVLDNFVINSDESARQDPFFYRVLRGHIAYEYIGELMGQDGGA